MSICRFTEKVRPKVALFRKVYGRVQEVGLGLRDLGCELNGVVAAIQMAYKGIQGYTSSIPRVG